MRVKIKEGNAASTEVKEIYNSTPPPQTADFGKRWKTIRAYLKINFKIKEYHSNYDKNIWLQNPKKLLYVSFYYLLASIISVLLFIYIDLLLVA